MPGGVDLDSAGTRSAAAVLRYTGLTIGEPLPEPEWVTRWDWIDINLARWGSCCPGRDAARRIGAAPSRPWRAVQRGQTRLPTAITLATGEEPLAKELQRLFARPYFRVYTNADVIGVEIGGALKNVIAIATGCSDGLGLGHNARAALITRGLAEIKRLGMAMGAHASTFYGLSGIGDLVLTCTGELSRNRTLGFKLGQGMKLKEVFARLSERGGRARGSQDSKGGL